MKLKVGVIFGGRSGEHEISIRSAKTVIEQIDKNKYEIIPIAINKKGEWLNPIKSIELLPADTAKQLKPILEQYITEDVGVVGDTRFKGLISLKNSSEITSTPIDVMFPVLHGTFGEDGTIQGLFEMTGIPYVGCGVLASSCGMDKIIMKKLFHAANLPICKYTWFLRNEWESNQNEIAYKIKSELGFPCFIKPANLGSSVGISKAEDEDTLINAIDLAAQYDRRIIVEEGLKVREIECAVIGNDEPTASLPGEYIVHTEDKKFLDYTEKYAGTGNNEFIVPAKVSETLSNEIRKMAVQAFKSIDGAGFARVDFFLKEENGELLVNEINTIPGLTDASGFPKMWAGSGKNFSEIIDLLIGFAIERFKDKSKNKTNI